MTNRGQSALHIQPRKNEQAITQDKTRKINKTDFYSGDHPRVVQRSKFAGVLVNELSVHCVKGAVVKIVFGGIILFCKHHSFNIIVIVKITVWLFQIKLFPGTNTI